MLQCIVRPISSLYVGHLNNRVSLISIRNLLRSSKPKPAPPKVVILKNEEITSPNLRVVYKNEDTGKEEHKLMGRLEAINFARSRSLDLILVSSASDPPVCRLDDSIKKKLVVEKKAKEIKANTKARELKEIHLGSQIAPHDLVTKMNKVKEFLDDGHPVKVSFIVDAKVMEKDPLALDQVILKVLEMLEKDASSVQPLQSKSHLRREFIVSKTPPKKPIKKS